MYLVGQLILLFISLYIFIIFWTIRKISLGKDYLLYVVFFLSIIYLFLVPIYNEVLDHELRQDIYFKILLYLVLLFYIPLFIFYSVKNQGTVKQNKTLVRVERKEWLFGIFCLFFAAAFYVISIPNSLFYGRDAVFNPELKYQLNFLQFLIYRSYIEYSPVILVLSTYILIKFGFKNYSAFYRFCYFFYLLSYLVFVLINSRMGLLILFLQFAGMVFLLGVKTHFTRKTYLLLAFSLVFVWYGYNVILNIRSNIDADGFQVSYLNPFDFRINSDVTEPINTRLDGVYLMAKMTPTAQEKGYALGKAWGVPLFLSIAPVLFPQQAQAIKSSYLTDSESYLVMNYTDLANSTMDFNSVWVTDLYCNFSFWGFLICSLFIGYVIVYAKGRILYPRTKLSLIIAFFLYCKILVFESESISVPLKLFKFIPLLLALLWILPVTTKSTITYDNHDHSDL
jgi:hypothetical protein